MRPANVLHLGFKELRSLSRDPIMLLLIVFAFTVSVYTAASAMPESMNRAAIAVVDEDGTQLSRRVIDAFEPPYFTEPVIISVAEMDQRMDAGLDTFALDIPPGFQRDVLAGRSPTVQLNVDATRMTQALSGSGYVQQIVNEEAARFLRAYRGAPAAAGVELNLRARFNPSLRASWFGALMQIIDRITMLSIILAGAALIREREHGTVEHLLAMPVTPFEIMAAKVWSMALVVLVAAALSLHFVVQGMLQVPVAGSVPLFLAVAAVHLFATTSIGIFLGTVARSMPQFALLFMLLFLPLQLLSGGTTPRESMPGFIQDIMLAAPTTHFIMAAQGILYRGAGLSVVWPNVVGLIGIGGLLFTLSLSRLRATIGRMI